MRKLEDVSESRPPVARPAPTVGHRNDLDAITAKDVHQTEGYARYFILQLAESQLTPRLFAQIIRRIERLARHPT